MEMNLKDGVKTSLVGNASTATKLQTARTINGVSFDGTANITLSPANIGAAASSHNHNGTYVYDRASCGGNMNDVAAYRNAMGMVSLSGTDTTVNPNGKTGWHHFINMSYYTESTNMWQTQIANAAGTTDLWVRSRAGGTVTAGTNWAAPWTRILTGSNYKNVVTPSNIGALPTVGGTMSGTAMITWADSGSWGASTGPSSTPRGGLQWTGQSDSVKVFAAETALDNLDMVIQFGDDNSNGLSIRNATGTQTAKINADGSALLASHLYVKYESSKVKLYII